MPPATPLNADDFANLVKRFAPWPDRFALGVSGGPDSMALALCAKDWAAKTGRHLIALIVDHALRPESGQEAETTQQSLLRLAVPAEILRWEHPPVVSRLHITARKARYHLLTEACRHHGITRLLLAHHREDQAETILMRLAKGSGIDGLVGIPERSIVNGIEILRPFLTIEKERLIATCISNQVPFIIDSSNSSPKFARGRLRRVMPLLTNEGLTIERLIDLGERAAIVKDALEHYTHAFLTQATQRDASGALHIDLNKLRAEPRAVGERALTACLQHLHPQDYAPEHVSLASLYKALLPDAVMPSRTLHGCIIGTKNKKCTVMREVDSIDIMPIHRGETVLWDRRWRVTLPDNADEPSCLIKPLGFPQHEILDRLAPGLLRQFPVAQTRASLPGLWVGNTLSCIPAFTSEYPARARAVLNSPWPPAMVIET